MEARGATPARVGRKQQSGASTTNAKNEDIARFAVCLRRQHKTQQPMHRTRRGATYYARVPPSLLGANWRRPHETGNDPSAMRGIMEDKHCLEYARVKAEGRVIRRCAATRSPLLLNLEAVRAGACVISNATLVPQARHAYAFTRHQTPVRSSARPLNVARATYKANRIIVHARTCASRTQKHLPHSTRCAALRERAGNLRTQGPL